MLRSIADLTLGLCQRLRTGEGVMENAMLRLHFYIFSGPFTSDLVRISTSWNWQQTFKSWQWWALLWQSGDQLATSWQAANSVFPLPRFPHFFSVCKMAQVVDVRDLFFLPCRLLSRERISLQVVSLGNLGSPSSLVMTLFNYF